jgi:hypothetical protein
MAAMKSGMLLAGNPILIKAGGTRLGIVCFRRLPRTEEYTAVAIVPKADLMLPATPPAVVIEISFRIWH